MNPKRTTLTRRTALQLLAISGAMYGFPAAALADTQTDLNSAQSRLATAQSELNAIATEYEKLSTEQSKTLDQIEAVKSKISKITTRIAGLERKLATKRRELSSQVSEEYKDGSRGMVDLFVHSTSVEELISNLYYYDKITDEQAQLIGEVNSMREECAYERAELEAQEASLEEVSRTQADQLKAMRGKQQEAQRLIDGLDKEVKDLIAKRDSELLAAQKEAARAQAEREAAEQKAAERKAAEQKAAEEAAQKKEQEQQAASQPSSKDSATASSGEEASAPAAAEEQEPAQSTGSAAAVVASCQSTPSPGGGLCAGWCSDVMINAGYGFVSGNANDMYAEFCFSSNRAELKPGMAVAVSTHPHSSAGRIYGHIGMYVGNNTVMDNIGYIRTTTLDEWCSYYGETVPVRWGWLNNIVLS